MDLIFAAVRDAPDFSYLVPIFCISQPISLISGKELT